MYICRAIFSLLLLLTIVGCGLGKNKDATIVEPPPGNPMGNLGVKAYQTNCARCHNELSTSNIKDRSLNEIKAAMKRSPMTELSITESEMAAIALILSSSADLIPPSVPANLRLNVLGPSSIVVSWNASQDNSGGSGVKGYHVYRNSTLVQSVENDLSFTDAGLTPSTKYTYRVFAYDNYDNVSNSSTAVDATTTAANENDVTAPPKPTGVVGQVLSATRIALSWNAVADESGGSGLKVYQVMRNDQYLTDIAPNKTTYLDVNLKASTPVKYHVRAVDNAGNMSTLSDALTVSTISADGVALYAARCTSCHLHGDTAAISNKRNRTALQIANAIATISQMKNHPTDKLEELGDDELKAIENALSDSADLSPPTVPTGLAGVPSFASITLTWNASTDVGSGIAGYRLFRQGVTNAIAVRSATDRAFTDTGLTASTTYQYQVEAYDLAGNTSAKSALVSVTTTANNVDTTPPGPPMNVRVSVESATRLLLSWDAAQDNAGGSGIKGYRVQRNGSLIGTYPATQLTLQQSNLAAATTYSYVVTAIDNYDLTQAANAVTGTTLPATKTDGANLYANRCVGCHHQSNIATSDVRNASASLIASKIANQPAMVGVSDTAPYYLGRLGADEIAAIALALSDNNDTTPPSTPVLSGGAGSSSRVNLTWTASTDAGSGLKYYKIYREATEIGVAAAGTLTFFEEGLAASTDYRYRVRAFDVANNPSSFSEYVTVKTLAAGITDNEPPSAPKNLTATAQAYSVTLQWMAATDNIAVVRYKIYQGANFIKDVAVPGLGTSINGLQGSTAYTFKVTAVDSAGLEGNAVSKNVTTLAPLGQNLYISRACASCHGLPPDDYIVGFTTKADFITKYLEAINLTNGQGPMQGMPALSNVERDAIAEWAITLTNGNNGNDGNTADISPNGFGYSLPVGTRQYIASSLKVWFAYPESTDAAQVSLVNFLNSSEVGKNAPMLGGSCSRYDDRSECSATRDQLPLYLTAAAEPRQSTGRSGYLLNACARTLETPVAVPNALARLGLDTASPINTASVVKIYGHFYPFRIPSNDVTASLVEVGNRALAIGITPISAWRMVMLPLCEDALSGGF